MARKRSLAVRVGLPTALTAVLATAVMIAVNIATTDSTTSPMAWVIVGVVTLASAAASFWLTGIERQLTADDTPIKRACENGDREPLPTRQETNQQYNIATDHGTVNAQQGPVQQPINSPQSPGDADKRGPGADEHGDLQ